METLWIALAALNRQLDAQIDRKRHIESKATVFLGLFAVMVSVVIGQWLTAKPWGFPYLQCVGLVSFLGTLMAVVLSLWPRNLHLPPDPEKLVRLLADSPESVGLNMAKSIQEGYSRNQEVLAHVTRFLEVGYCLLVVDVLVVVLPSAVRIISALWR